MEKYYSQNGEDYILSKLFEGKMHGFFVEVGCIDGKRFSNTLHFEEKGWKGICVEAHADYIELLKNHRPNSIVSYCAVGRKDEKDVTFYANFRGSLSTLDKSKEKEFEKYGIYFQGFEEQIVQMRSLASIFKEHEVKDVDLLSLDIEGYEVEALKGMDFNIVKPSVLVVESDSFEHEKKLDKILFPQGYTKFGKLASNIFYLSQYNMGDKLKDKNYKVILTHTNHPKDNNKDEEVFVEINMPVIIKRTDRKRKRLKYLKLIRNFFQ